MNLSQQECTRIIREILVSKPLPEAAINPGMKILYAEAQPIGLISVEIGEVSKNRDGRLDNGTRGFRSIIPTGQEGKYEFHVNHKLEIVFGPQEDTLLTVIYDKERAINSDDRFTTLYNDNLFTFKWRTSYVVDVKVAEKPTAMGNNGIVLFTKKDPRRMRFGVPGDIIKPDENTLEYALNEGASWMVKQRIVDGPTGHFSTLGYRQIPNDIYERMFDCENVILLSQHRK